MHPDLVVIALGTNDSGAGSGYGADVDAVMQLPARRPAGHLGPPAVAGVPPARHRPAGRVRSTPPSAAGPSCGSPTPTGSWPSTPSGSPPTASTTTPPATRPSATPSSPTWRRASGCRSPLPFRARRRRPGRRPPSGRHHVGRQPVDLPLPAVAAGVGMELDRPQRLLGCLRHPPVPAGRQDGRPPAPTGSPTRSPRSAGASPTSRVGTGRRRRPGPTKRPSAGTEAGGRRV